MYLKSDGHYCKIHERMVRSYDQLTVTYNMIVYQINKSMGIKYWFEMKIFYYVSGKRFQTIIVQIAKVAKGKSNIHLSFIIQKYLTKEWQNLPIKIKNSSSHSVVHFWTGWIMDQVLKYRAAAAALYRPKHWLDVIDFFCIVEGEQIGYVPEKNHTLSPRSPLRPFFP